MVIYLSKISLDKYLNEKFPLLALKQPLFYNFPVGIRFDLGGDLEVCEGRIEQCYTRSYTLFNEINKVGDKLFVVLFLDSCSEFPISKSESEIFKVFKNYFYGIDFSANIYKDVLDYRYKEPGDVDDTKRYRFYISCKVEEIDIKEMIVAKLNQDIGNNPCLIGDLYLINQSNNTIFNIYDDRGLDIVANSKDTLIQVYKKYKKWTLEYDREIIEQRFS